MFTGIIKNVSSITKSSSKNGLLNIVIPKTKGVSLRLGDSVALDGVCLTVKSLSKNGYEMVLMPETLKKTTFGYKVPGRANLETPLRASDVLGGHMVLGHVDTVGEIISKKTQHTAGEETFYYRISFPKEFKQFVVSKGSIAIDGISLTVIDVGKDWFTVGLIPYTLKHTTIGSKEVGDTVNLEFDIMAKHIHAALNKYHAKK